MKTVLTALLLSALLAGANYWALFTIGGAASCMPCAVIFLGGPFVLGLALAGILPALSRPRVAGAEEPIALTEEVSAPVAAAPPAENAALRLLAALQEDGRLVDFLTEDIQGYSDEQIGAATRGIHDACRKALRELRHARARSAGPRGRDRDGAGGLRSRRRSPDRATCAASRRSRARSRHAGWRVTVRQHSGAYAARIRRSSRPPRSRSAEGTWPTPATSSASTSARRTRSSRTSTRRAEIGADAPDVAGARRAAARQAGRGRVARRGCRRSSISPRRGDEAGEPRAAVGHRGARGRRARPRARRRGARPAWSSSAKSWLCLGRRRPERSRSCRGTRPTTCAKLSPVDAAAAYLRHLRAAWDAAHARAARGAGACYLTVPASFDAAARELTVRAAEQAGLASARPPRGAAGGVLRLARGHARAAGASRSRVGDVILVCDVGGGTTDLTLVAVGEEEGSAGARAHGRRRPHPARRRQHGPDAGPHRPRAARRQRDDARRLAAPRPRARAAATPRRTLLAADAPAEGAGRRARPGAQGDRRRRAHATSRATRSRPRSSTASSPWSRATTSRAARAASACRRSACRTPAIRRSRATWPRSSPGTARSHPTARAPCSSTAASCSADASAVAWPRSSPRVARRRRARARGRAISISRWRAAPPLRARAARARRPHPRRHGARLLRRRRDRGAGGAGHGAAGEGALRRAVRHGRGHRGRRCRARSSASSSASRPSSASSARRSGATTSPGTVVEGWEPSETRGAAAARGDARRGAGDEGRTVPVRARSASVTEVGTLELWCVARDGAERVEAGVQRAAGDARACLTDGRALPRRHRPRHDQHGVRLRRHARPGARSRVFEIPAARGAGEVARAADAAVVPLPGRRARRCPPGASTCRGRAGATSASACSRASRARACRGGSSRRPSRGSVTAASTARRRSCRGARADDVREDLAGRGVGARPRAPARSVGRDASPSRSRSRTSCSPCRRRSTRSRAS